MPFGVELLKCYFKIRTLPSVACTPRLHLSPLALIQRRCPTNHHTDKLSMHAKQLFSTDFRLHNGIWHPSESFIIFRRRHKDNCVSVRYWWPSAKQLYMRAFQSHPAFGLKTLTKSAAICHREAKHTDALNSVIYALHHNRIWLGKRGAMRLFLLLSYLYT